MLVNIEILPKHIRRFIVKTNHIAIQNNISQIHAECFEVNDANFEPHCSKCKSFKKCLSMKTTY